MAKHMLRESDLYPPIKSFLEVQGYKVKSEIGAVDVVACRADEPPVLVELKTSFSLSLIHQAVARQSVSDLVYIVAPRKTGRRFLKSLKDNKMLCRRLGLGLITVRLKDALVEVHLDPGPYRPRKSKHQLSVLLREFERRRGDPNQGGSTRLGLVTAYRQDALECATHLLKHGASRGRDVAGETQVDRATTIMRDNHYGWFCKQAVGIYDLTPKGADVARQKQGDTD